MAYDKNLLHRTRRAIGRNIHELRARRRISLGDLSRLSGLPEFLLDRYEIGRGDIGVPHMLRIACALGTTPGALLTQQQRCFPAATPL